MKVTLKVALVISLFCTTAFADGEMTSGGKTCSENCLADRQASTTIIANRDEDKSENDYANDLLTFVSDFLADIFS